MRLDAFTCVYVSLGLPSPEFSSGGDPPLVPGFVGPARALSRRADRLCEARARVIPLHHPPWIGNDARPPTQLHIQPSVRQSHIPQTVCVLRWSERWSRGPDGWFVLWIKRRAPKQNHTERDALLPQVPILAFSPEHSLPTNFRWKCFAFLPPVSLSHMISLSLLINIHARAACIPVLLKLIQLLYPLPVDNLTQ